MKYPLIGIIGGKGKMGTFFHRFFSSLGYEVIISDKNTKLTTKDVAKKADVVIVSVPMHCTEQIIKQEIAPYVRKNALLTDLTSNKIGPVQAMLKSKADVIGCHPVLALLAE